MVNCHQVAQKGNMRTFDLYRRISVPALRIFGLFGWFQCVVKSNVQIVSVWIVVFQICLFRTNIIVFMSSVM